MAELNRIERKMGLVASAIVLALLGYLVMTGIVPRLFGVSIAVPNLVTVVLYAWDKYQAKKGGQRIPEATLHMWSFVGGWPAAFFSQEALSHKTTKVSFRLIHWAIVLLHILIIGVWGWKGYWNVG